MIKIKIKINKDKCVKIIFNKFIEKKRDLFSILNQNKKIIQSKIKLIFLRKHIRLKTSKILSYQISDYHKIIVFRIKLFFSNKNFR